MNTKLFNLICLFALMMIFTPLLSACKNYGISLKIVTSECNILYEPDSITEEEVQSLADKIKQKTKVTPNVQIVDNSIEGINYNRGTIIIGNIFLSENEAALKSLKKNDYICGIYGDFYCIAGGTHDAMLNAVAYFENKVLPKGKNRNLRVYESKNIHFKDDYVIENLYIGNTHIKDCEIVVPDTTLVSEKTLAGQIQQYIYNESNALINITTASNASKNGQIVIGKSLCGHSIVSSHGYKITCQDNKLLISSNSYLGYIAAWNALQEIVLNGSDLNLDSSYFNSGNGVNLATATINNDSELRFLYNNVWGDDGTGYSLRAEMLVSVYEAYQPDVIGLQEFSPTFRKYANPKLKALGYTEVPVSAETGFIPEKNETKTRNPIYYKSDKLELLDYGYCCLGALSFNEYPELLGNYTAEEIKAIAEVHKSKAVNWAIFKNKKTNNIVMCASVHLWYKNGNDHDVARTIQMRKMREVLTQKANDYLTSNNINGEMPILVGGDYNSRVGRPSLSSMSNGEIPFEEINNLAPITDRISTTSKHSKPVFNAQHGIWEPAALINHNNDYSIDHIFGCVSSRQTYTIRRANVINDLYALCSSDHSPIFVDFSFTSSAPKTN